MSTSSLEVRIGLGLGKGQTSRIGLGIEVGSSVILGWVSHFKVRFVSSSILRLDHGSM